MTIFALDIDGTLTDKSHQIPPEVVAFLEKKVSEGYSLILVTGRTLSYAKKAIHVLDFPYTIICQHGADVVEMPEERSLLQNYLSKETAMQIDSQADCIIYSGFALGDFCYYRDHRFNSETKEYFKKLETLASASWVAVDSWNTISQTSFPLVKCVGDEKRLASLCESLRSLPSIHVEMIRDPIWIGKHLVMVTDKSASKGNVLRQTIDKKNLSGRVIAAGDDQNDVSLLKAADVGIAMKEGPSSLKEVADIIAEDGIVAALKEAIDE